MQCAEPGCTAEFAPSSGPGRPRKYCDPHRNPRYQPTGRMPPGPRPKPKAEPEPRRQVCPKCSRLRHINAFAEYQMRGKTYRRRVCNVCERKRHRTPEARAAASARKARFRARHAEELREAERQRNGQPARVASRKKYEQTEKGKAAQRRYKARRKRMAVARLPYEVCAPYFERLLRYMKAEYPDDALEVLAEWAGCPRDQLYRYTAGLRSSVPQEVMDALSLEADFTLDELIDRAREWALLTGDSWPMGKKYAPRASAAGAHPDRLEAEKAA